MATVTENPATDSRTARRVLTVVVVLLLVATGLHLALLPAAKDEQGDPHDVTDRPLESSERLLPKTASRITPVQFSSVEVTATANPANPLDAERAYGYLKQLCDLGPRPSGSDAMRRQRELVVEHFEAAGADVSLQTFTVKHPVDGSRVAMANVVAEWRPEATQRVLLCAHYDTRPLPDRDPNPIARRSGRFLGANDGASGTAVLMELAHHMDEYRGAWGVDFVLFDGEELVYNERRDRKYYFLGSRRFAELYKKRRPKDWSYRWAILLDMVGDADLQLYYEKHSFRDKRTRPLVEQVWGAAQRLGVAEFTPREKHEVLDDHLALREVGGIPAIDIIDFDYPYWHTEADSPRKCSGESLAKVGWVVWEWLRAASPAAEGDAP